MIKLNQITDIYFPYKKGKFVDDLIHLPFFYSYKDDVIPLYNDDKEVFCEKLKSIFIKLLSTIIEQKNYDDEFFSFSYFDDSGKFDFRGNNMGSNDGLIVHLRVIPEIPSIHSLRLSPHIKANLLSPELNGGGLILFIAQTGQGKSTLMDSVIIERLNIFGGFCVTCEDPIEAVIEGYHKAGYCAQQGVTADVDMFGLIRNASRSLPAIGHNMLMIGEVNDVNSVVQGIDASANGNIVLMTGHGKSIEDFLNRIFAMYASVKDEKLARQILKSTLKVAMYWNRIWDNNTSGWDKGIYSGNYLSTIEGNDQNKEIANLVGEGKLSALKSHYIDLD